MSYLKKKVNDLSFRLKPTHFFQIKKLIKTPTCRTRERERKYSKNAEKLFLWWKKIKEKKNTRYLDISFSHDISMESAYRNRIKYMTHDTSEGSCRKCMKLE